MATHSSVLAWRIPGTAEPGGLLSMGLHRVRHDWSDLAAAAACFQFILRNCQTLQGSWLHHFAFPTAVYEDSSFFIFSPMLVISCFFFIIAILVGVKWRWKSLSRVRLCYPMDSTVRGILQARIVEWVHSPGDLPNPGIEPRSPALQMDSLPTEPQGKPKNTGVRSLSLLQWIFPTQELNWGLLHCRRILYQLRYRRIPAGVKWVLFAFLWLLILLFNHYVVSDSLWPHGLQHTRLPCPSLSPWVCSDSYPLVEDNGNPLQYSCLENPMDGGAWWAAICGVAQSRTWLKWLSSSSSSSMSIELMILSNHLILSHPLLLLSIFSSAY